MEFPYLGFLEEIKKCSETELSEKEKPELEESKVESEISIPKPKKITCDMVYNVRYDAAIDTATESASAAPSDDALPDVDLLKWSEPCAMIVFGNSDLHNAARLVAKAAQMPFASNTIAVVVIERSIRNTFITKVRANLKPLQANIANHDIFKRTQEAIMLQNAATVTAPESVAPAELSPIIVCDVPQNDLSYGPSGAITLHTFRSEKEAVKLIYKESLNFKSISIWRENFTANYALTARLRPKIFYFNCHGIDLEPVRAHFAAPDEEGYAIIVKNYHYEVITFGIKKMIVVFPVGTIFAN